MKDRIAFTLGICLLIVAYVPTGRRDIRGARR